MTIQKTKSNWPVTYRWAAVGTLVAYSAIGAKSFNVASAAELRRLASSPGANTAGQHSQPVRRFAIPPGALDSALNAFSQVTGVSISLSRLELGSLPSPGVNGTFTPEQALQKLLAGTGASYRFKSPSAALIELKNVSTSVEVTASIEALAGSSPKYTQPALDTPQSITPISQQTMQQQGVTTLRDALRNVSGISLAAGEGGAQGDNLTIRGFAARNDLFIDGMRDFGSYYRDPFNTEEVEVLQGPSSVTFGRGSTGGVVNQASKTPGLSRFLSGDVDFGTDLTRRVAFDVDLPVPTLGKTAAFRLNVMGDEGDVAGRDVAENRRFGIAPSLAWGLGTDTRFTLSYFHQNADDQPDYGIPWLFNGPAPVDRTNYYGFKDGNYLRTYDDIGTAKAEHDVNSHVTVRDQLRYAHYVRDVLITEPQVPAGVTLATPLDSIQVIRHEIGVNSTETFLDEQLDVTAHFDTGLIHHAAVAGVEAGRETSDPTRPTWSQVAGTSLLNPDPSDSLGGAETITTRVQTTALSQAAYALDTMSLGRHWDVTGGFRWDRFDTQYSQSVVPAASFHRVDEMPSWRAALVYKPVAMGSIYFAAGTSFNPSAESLSLSASNANLPPEKNRSYEVGTKWDLPAGRLSLRSALFDTTKLNAREPDPLNSLLNILAGTQRVQGVDLEIQSHLTSRWDLLGGYAHLDARLVASSYYPAAVGAQLANVPRNSFNLWTTYRLPWRIEAGFGGNFVSSRTASSRRLMP
jgi:catecholate siderophore receptor